MVVKLNTCGQVTRVLFIILNVLFLLIGVGLIAGGGYLVATGNNIRIFSGVISPVGVSALIIVAGIFTFLVAAFAILGAIIKSKILLGIYLVIVVLVILLEVAAAIVGIVKRGDVVTATNSFVEGLLNNYENNTQDALIVDQFQELFQCCGWLNYTDYQTRSISIPESCDCTAPAEQNKCVSVSDGDIWKRGCQAGVNEALSRYLGVVIAVAIIFALIEALAVFCACGLCCCIIRGTENYTKV